ncbi:nuclear protein [Podila clonocystis]|nr:nuclear protein [Podila clonocystis]
MSKHRREADEMDQENDDRAQVERLKNQKRQIRQQYRELINDTEANRKELMEPSNNGLLENVDRANKLYRSVFGTHEATLDAKLLVMSADLGMQKAKHLRMGQGGFDETEYVTRLINKMGGHDVENEQQGLDWSKIGRMAVKWTRRVPTMDFMLGPMSIEHKSRNDTRRKRVVRDPNQMRKPQELKEDDIARQENETTKNVVQISDILDQCEQDRVNLFELVINPESFGQTIENIFYLSFLVRDGKVSISEVDVNNPDDDLHDDHKTERDNANIQPMVELTEVPTAEDYQAGLFKKQMVMELDMATWRELIEVYNIRKPMIPTRVAKQKLDGKWYG